jgi:hypothetical protein
MDFPRSITETPARDYLHWLDIRIPIIAWGAVTLTLVGKAATRFQTTELSWSLSVILCL